MNCNNCGHKNRPDSKFCSECGASLAILCPQCNAEITPTARFCDMCGTPLTGNGANSISESTTPLATVGDDTREDISEAGAERRQLTVMFCDLVGSSVIAEKLDPEDLRNLLAAYHERCDAVIRDLGGHIARYVGDGLLVYFGFPTAYEDSAVRAVDAALRIFGEIQALDAERNHHGIKLAVRIGINTGAVVVGDIGSGDSREEMAVVGDVPNVAARLQAIANPQEVVIGDSTQRLVGDLFVADDLGEQHLKGISGPVRAYLVRERSAAPNPFEAGAMKGLTAMVGRDADIELLCDRWSQAGEGEGQVLLLSGEAGIGKSRILKGFRDRLQDQAQSMIFYYCSAHHSSSAFFPVIAQLERALGFDNVQTSDEKLDKLDALLTELGLQAPELCPLYASLLGLPFADRYPPLQLSPEQLKKNIIEALISGFQATTTTTPLLMIVEDVHWLDPSSLELLNIWIEQLRSHRVFLILSYRPDYQFPWHGHSHITSLTLNRLSRKESVEIVVKVTGGKTLPDEVLDQIVAKTDGIPLFLEELTKMVIESGLLEELDDRYALHGSLPPLAIPASLQDSLMARLDRLEVVKEVAQLGATIGRLFSHDLLAVVSRMSEEELSEATSQLVTAELIFRRGILPDVIYEFKHALVQDAAYQSLLKSTRHRYHHRIARALEDKFPQIVKTAPELLAYHYTEAQLAEEAITYWSRAGQQAASRSANLEAIDHLTKGLGVLSAQPDNPERTRRELELQIALAVPLTAAKGYAAPEVQQTYTRARELCRNLGDTPRLFPVLYGMCRFYLLRAEYASVLEFGRELVAIVDKVRDPAFFAGAHRATGSAFVYLGEVSNARTHLTQVLETTVSEADRARALTYDIVDVWVVSRAYDAWTLWLLGYPDQARRQAEKSIEVARDLNHLFSLALAYSFAAWTYQFCGDKARARELAEAALALSREHGFQFWIGWAEILQSWSLVDDASNRNASEQIRQGLTNWRSTGSELGQTYFLGLLADALSVEGKIDSALEVLGEAQKFCDRTGEAFWEAEIYRAKGELLLRQSPPLESEAEACFRKALELANAKQLRSLALRAVMSLTRLRQGHDDEMETRQQLEEIYAGFEEGFDTSDLCQAQALINQGTLLTRSK